MRNVLRRRSRIRHFTEVEFGTAGKSVENLEDRRLLSVVSIPSYDILTSRNFSYASQDSLRVRLTAEAEEQYDDFFGTNAEKPEQYIVDGHSVERQVDDPEHRPLRLIQWPASIFRLAGLMKSF